jgi:hypothetical protein
MSSPVAKQTVLSVLRDPAIERINFVIGGYEIRPRLYERVRGAVDGLFGPHIEVVANPHQADAAWYDSDANRLSLRSVLAETDTRKALIVHEATHAGCDLLNYHQMRTDTSEAAAYIAQCIFLRQKTSAADLAAGNRLTSSNRGTDRILEQAWAVAGQILAHGFSHRRDTEELQDRIRHSTRYNPDHLQEMPAAGFNG